MSATDSLFQRALVKLLTEVFEGPPGAEAFVLNPGDRGLLGQLESIDAHAASSRHFPGKTTIASHMDHVLFGLTLMNRWAAGEPNPFAGADWEQSWRHTKVSEADWRKLRDELRRHFETWRAAVAGRTTWDDLSAAGSIASAAHTAYHLGAIRQILAAMPAATSAGNDE